MVSNEEGKQLEKSVVGASATGISVGTLTMVISQLLPTDSAFKSFLLYISPSVSILSSVVFSWAEGEIKKYNSDKKLRTAYNDVTNHVTETLNNPNLSDEHKSKVKVAYENANNLLIQNKISNMESLVVSENQKPVKKSSGQKNKPPS